MRFDASYIAVVITLLGGLIAGSMRFASVEARLNSDELALASIQGKLDSLQIKIDGISAGIYRVEGRMEEADKFRKSK
jgi:hypothetical protein